MQILALPGKVLPVSSQASSLGTTWLCMLTCSHLRQKLGIHPFPLEHEGIRADFQLSGSALWMTAFFWNWWAIDSRSQALSNAHSLRGAFNWWLMGINTPPSTPHIPEWDHSEAFVLYRYSRSPVAPVALLASFFTPVTSPSFYQFLCTRWATCTGFLSLACFWVDIN